MPEPRPNFYAHSSLDRLAHRRLDEAFLAGIRRSSTTQGILLWRSHVVIAGSDDAPRPLFIGPEVGEGIAADPIFLGVDAERAFLAHAIEAADREEAERRAASLGGRLIDLRAVGSIMARDEAALLAYARGVMWWHERHRFCGVCGHPTVPREAGHRRECTNPACATLHFPRTDPAVIVLVTDGDRALLGRQAVWAPGMHSVLAGFLEPGESLEDCVRREVREEAGIEVADVVYQSSQPWPFPQSLMVGFRARAVTTAIRICDDELEHAGWYDRAFLNAVRGRPMSSGGFTLSRPDSIARRLIEDWLDEAG